MFWTGHRDSVCRICFPLLPLARYTAFPINRRSSSQGLLGLAAATRYRIPVHTPWTSPSPSSRNDDMSYDNAQVNNSTFGEPIGGVSVKSDFIPNLLFCLAFAFIFGWGVCTLFFSPRRRTLLRIGSISLCLERMLVFSIRMAASFRQDVRESWGLSEYQEVALSLGTYFFVHIYSPPLTCCPSLKGFLP
jgi:hypothetical protein